MIAFIIQSEDGQRILLGHDKVAVIANKEDDNEIPSVIWIGLHCLYSLLILRGMSCTAILSRVPGPS